MIEQIINYINVNTPFHVADNLDGLFIWIVGIVGFVLFMQVVEFLDGIFGYHGQMPWDHKEDDDYTGADWSDHA